MSGTTSASSARACGPWIASTARVSVTSAISHSPRLALAASRVLTIGSVFDAFGITSSSSGSTHHTMMSSTTCASSGSSRCVYWARPGPMRSEVVRERPLEDRHGAAPRHLHRPEVRDVEHDRALAARPVLFEHAAVLDRHVPTAELGQARVQRPVLRVERTVLRAPRSRRLRHAYADSASDEPGGVAAAGSTSRRNGSGGPSRSTSWDGGSSPYFTSRCR